MLSEYGWRHVMSCNLKLPTALGIESASRGTMQASWLLSAKVELHWEELNSKGNCSQNRSSESSANRYPKKWQRYTSYASNFCELRLRCASFQCYPVIGIWKETCLVPFFAVIFLLEEFMIWKSQTPTSHQNEPVPQHQPVFVDQASQKIVSPADSESSHSV